MATTHAHPLTSPQLPNISRPLIPPIADARSHRIEFCAAALQPRCPVPSENLTDARAVDDASMMREGP